jgi:hypothetical protein
LFILSLLNCACIFSERYQILLNFFEKLTIKFD